MTIPAGTLVPRDARDFGTYQLLAKLATGGMAEIFLARPTGSAVQHDVLVLKRILPHLAEDEHFVTMFRDEADLASKLLHKNVCQVMSFGQFAGTWFIAMEYLHGVPLSRMMTKLSKAGKMLDFRVVAGIIVQACEGLHSAHEARGSDGHVMGVVHRDVSPPNIMVCADGTVKLLDFGIAKARGANSRTRTGTVKGKNAYMSPEQILGKPLDRRSDIFALAVVMYEMLSIKRLFHRDSDFLTFKAITEEPIPDIKERRPDLPAQMRAALIQAMARDPSGRFATAQEFGNAIRASVAPLGGLATLPDLARLLGADFGDEMSARDEILKAADDPNAAPATAPTTGPMLRQSSSGMAPPPLPMMRAQAPTPALPQPTRSGELMSQPTAPTGPMARQSVDSVPSMLVTPGSARMQAANLTPALTPPMATPAPMPGLPGMPSAPLGSLPAPAVPDLSGSMPVDNWMADPDTDLLRAHRTRTLLKVFGALVALGLAAAAVWFLLAADGGNGDTPSSDGDAKAGATPAAVDAGVYVPRPDAKPEMSHDQIVALSKFGFYTVDASAPTQVVVDTNPPVATPVRMYPLTPGPHKVHAVGPNGKVKDSKIVIIGGQTTDDGMITW
nr:protein kinase [Kofleriaceae bacterium]